MNKTVGIGFPGTENINFIPRSISKEWLPSGTRKVPDFLRRGPEGQLCRLKSYLASFNHPELGKLVGRDRCCRIVDWVGLAAVFLYFERSRHAHQGREYTYLEVAKALFLFHEIEEDCSHSRSWLLNFVIRNLPKQVKKEAVKIFLKERFELFTEISHQGVVTVSQCVDVVSLYPHHHLWQRHRDTVHGGAASSKTHSVCPKCKSKIPLNPRVMKDLSTKKDFKRMLINSKRQSYWSSCIVSPMEISLNQIDFVTPTLNDAENIFATEDDKSTKVGASNAVSRTTITGSDTGSNMFIRMCGRSSREIFDRTLIADAFCDDSSPNDITEVTFTNSRFNFQDIPDTKLLGTGDSENERPSCCKPKPQRSLRHPGVRLCSGKPQPNPFDLCPLPTENGTSLLAWLH